jgi:hypothetical protein
MSKKLSKVIINKMESNEPSRTFLINAKDAENCRLAIFYSYGGSLDDIKYSFNSPGMEEVMHIKMSVPERDYNKVIDLLNELNKVS